MTKKAYGSLNPKISREICNNMKIRIHLIVGARPNFMKMAPLYKALKERSESYIPTLIHTGQHYDEKMSKLFFEDLGLPEPDAYLHVGLGDMVSKQHVSSSAMRKRNK
jgi:UDP-N-acetylglucosamine 2-epimerase